MMISSRFLALCTIVLLVALLPGRGQADTGLQPFTTATLAQVQQQYQHKPFLLVLWSVHCAPCFAELAMLGEQLAEHPDLPLILVSTDADAAPADVLMLLEDYGLQAAQAWQFGDEFAEKLRWHIDPFWYGELPRSYLYAASHARSSHSGQLSRELVVQWLGNEYLDQEKETEE